MTIFYIFFAVAFFGLSYARGINCRGSFFCGKPAVFAVTPGLQSVLDLIDQTPIQPTKWFQNGEHIVCSHGIDARFNEPSPEALCVFLQGTGGMPGSDILPLLKQLRDHGCKGCGSIPVFYPRDNDESHHGILTANYVSNAKDCYGVCNPT